MKSTLITLAATAAMALIGCDKGTPGGPGVVNPTSKTPRSAEDTFHLDVPNMAISLKQGEVKTSSISVKRNKNFGEDVRLKFGELPKGLTMDPASPTIKNGEEEAKLTFTAADDAALGEFNIQVTGTPTKGADAVNTIKVNISKK